MTRETSKKYIVLAAVIALIGIGGLLLALRVNADATAPTEAAAPPDPYEVEDDLVKLLPATAATAGILTQPTRPSTHPSTLTLSGRTDLDQERVTHVHAQFPGRVVQVGGNPKRPDQPLQLGDLVQGPPAGSTGPNGGRGTILCRIESVDLAQAKSAYLQARVQLAVDNKAVELTQKLFDKNVVAEKALLDVKSTQEKDRAAFEGTLQQLRIFGLNDADITKIEQQQGAERMTYDLTSPRTGMIVEKGVVGGELTDPTLNLFTVADTSTLWVWGDVYERDLPRVRVGQKMEVTLTSDPTRGLSCKVDWISPVIDASTRSIKIRGSLDNKEGKLLAQMYATVVVTINDAAGAIEIPATAVVTHGERSFAFVQEPSEADKRVFRRVPVTVEPINAGPGLESAPSAQMTGPNDVPPMQQVVRVTAGLSLNQQVVTAGALGLFDEMQTQQKNEQQQRESQPTQTQK